MAKTLTSTISVAVSGYHVNGLDLGNAAFPFAASLSLVFASGTGASQADLVFTDTRTLGASATEDLDLFGVLTDAYGATLNFAKLKAAIFFADPLNTNNVQVTRPAANGVTLFLAVSDGLSIPPGGVFALAWPGTGLTVTTGTADLITVTNSAGSTSVTYKVILLGTSA
jgi:hypothetical protein